MRRTLPHTGTPQQPVLVTHACTPQGEPGAQCDRGSDLPAGNLELKPKACLAGVTAPIARTHAMHASMDRHRCMHSIVQAGDASA